mmetsp:Transcript_30076/g.70107  ORF Transcript_30076/g.70107 Transcript_30076/m.70107 type:complete len:338 (+) Transcript_30076:91-1104(+)
MAAKTAAEANAKAVQQIKDYLASHPEEAPAIFKMVQAKKHLVDHSVTKIVKEKPAGLVKNSAGDDSSSSSEDPVSSDDSTSEDDDEYQREGRVEQIVAKAEAGELTLDDLKAGEVHRLFSKQRDVPGVGAALAMAAASGQQTKAFEPWWLGSDKEVQSNLPAPPAEICLNADKTLDASIAFHVLEVLYGYCHTMRACNGDLQQEPLQAAIHFLQISPSMSEHRKYRDASDCLDSVLSTAAALPGGGFGAALDSLCMSDASVLIQGGVCRTRRALREAADLMQAVGSGLVSKKAASFWQRVLRKLAMWESFAYHHNDLLQPLSPQIDAFSQQRQSRGI